MNDSLPPANFLDRLAVRLGPWPFSLLVGLVAVLAASLVAEPALAPDTIMGQLNVELAADPFANTPNAMATRFLTPSAAWLLGLRGEGLLVLIAVMCVILPAAGARWALARSLGATGAFLTAGTLGLTLLTRTSWHHGGMTDVVTYLLVFAVWARRAQPRLVALFLVLALFNNERVIFLWPFFAWLLFQETEPGRRRPVLLACFLPVILWLPVYLGIQASREVEHSLAYYLEPLLNDPLIYIRQAWPWQALGFLSAFQWLWFVPLWLAWRLGRSGSRQQWMALLLPLFCAGGQMFLAYDSSRLAALAFPCLLPALENGLRNGGPSFRRNLTIVLVLQAVTPQVFTAAHIIEIMPGWLWP